MSYASRAKDSIYDRDERGNLVVENAVIFWTNFAGEPTRFNSQGGKRTFVLALDEPVANQLMDEGWNIKKSEPRDDQDDPLYYTEIVINMNSKYEPKVLLCTEWNGKKKMTRLHGNNVKTLDDIRYANVDLVIHPHVYENGAKGYCNTIAVTQAKSNLFNGKYDDYDMDDYSEESEDDETVPF